MQAAELILFTAAQHYNKLWLVDRQPEGTLQAFPREKSLQQRQRAEGGGKGSWMQTSSGPGGGALS